MVDSLKREVDKYSKEKLFQSEIHRQLIGKIDSLSFSEWVEFTYCASLLLNQLVC